MSKVSISFHITCVSLLICFLTTGFVSSDDGESTPINQIITKDAFSFTIPNPFGDKPLFETNDQNGRLIAIHIPIIYDGQVHFRGPGLMGTKMTGSLLGGLLSFTYDKTPQTDGNLHGPVRVSSRFYIGK